MKRKLVSRIITLIAMGVLILDSRHAAESAWEGIELCIRTVIPSLFPFFVLSIYLTGNMGKQNAAASVVLSGFLGGYPVGAQAAAENLRRHSLNQAQANRMLMFCSQAGPAFLFGMAARQFPEVKYGWYLWATQILSAVSVAALLPKSEIPPGMAAEDTGVSLADAMKDALRAISSVCGWVVLFRVILGYVGQIPLADPWDTLLWGILELTNGCVNLVAIEDLSTRFLLAAAMLNFGGLCVFAQTLSVARDLDIRYYLAGKLLQTGFCIPYALFFLGHWQAIIPVFCLILLLRRGIPAKRGSIPAKVGV